MEVQDVQSSPQAESKPNKRRLSPEEFGAINSIKSIAGAAFGIVESWALTSAESFMNGVPLMEQSQHPGLVAMRTVLISPDLKPEERLAELCLIMGVDSFEQLQGDRSYVLNNSRAAASCITSKFTQRLIEEGFLSQKEIRDRNSIISANKVKAMAARRQQITMSPNNEGLILFVVDELNNQNNYLTAKGGRHYQTRDYLKLCTRVNEFMGERVDDFKPFPSEKFRSRLNQFVHSLDAEYQALIKYNQLEKVSPRTTADLIEVRFSTFDAADEVLRTNIFGILGRSDLSRYEKFCGIANLLGVSKLNPNRSKSTERAISVLNQNLIKAGVLDEATLHRYMDLQRIELARAARRNGHSEP